MRHERRLEGCREGEEQTRSDDKEIKPQVIHHIMVPSWSRYHVLRYRMNHLTTGNLRQLFTFQISYGISFTT